ncbi:PREDICTED: heterogeneous nuclear ribonucleoprotein U-like protein 2, partial [Chinchilla lanigera]|uniref:heterogeneous nuclear ribonucleoprotein U-like protein 2 n=1 Tax=Chinchilla lanigera TaxID=34839 RepID=UPI00038EBA91
MLSRRTAIVFPWFVGDDQDSEKSKPAGSDGERRGVKRQRDEKDEHGRAYYEFREEAHHSRSKSPPPPEEEAKEEEEDQTLVNLDTCMYKTKRLGVLSTLLKGILGIRPGLH